MPTETERTDQAGKAGKDGQGDLASSSVFEQDPANLYGYVNELREECPVHWDPGLQGWFVTKYQDVHDVMSDAEHYRLQARPEEQYDEHQSKDRVTTFRRMLREATLRPYRDTIVTPELDSLFKAFEGEGRVEFYSQFASPYPPRVIARIFGLEESDFGELMEYRDARSALFNAPADAAEEIQKRSAEWQAKLEARMREIIEARRAEPGDDLTTWLLDAEEDGKPIPDDEIVQIAVRDLLMAGSETSVRAICNAVYRMLTVPGMYEKLLADRSLVHGFVEEALRYDPPAQLFWRAPNQDVELSGCPIEKDSQIYTSIVAANRDPEKFKDPEEFDITRKIGRHMTFSAGAHRCPGAWLGRTETELTVNAVLERMPNLRFDPDAPEPELNDVVLRNWMPLHLLFDPK